MSGIAEIKHYSWPSHSPVERLGQCQVLSQKLHELFALQAALVERDPQAQEIDRRFHGGDRITQTTARDTRTQRMWTGPRGRDGVVSRVGTFTDVLKHAHDYWKRGHRRLALGIVWTGIPTPNILSSETTDRHIRIPTWNLGKHQYEYLAEYHPELLEQEPAIDVLNATLAHREGTITLVREKDGRYPGDVYYQIILDRLGQKRTVSVTHWGSGEVPPLRLDKSQTIQITGDQEVIDIAQWIVIMAQEEQYLEAM